MMKLIGVVEKPVCAAFDRVVADQASQEPYLLLCHVGRVLAYDAGGALKDGRCGDELRVAGYAFHSFNVDRIALRVDWVGPARELVEPETLHQRMPYTRGPQPVLV